MWSTRRPSVSTFVYDETEDSRPRILLHVSSNIVNIDTNVSPPATQARRIGIHLLEAAEELDGWRDGR